MIQEVRLNVTLRAHSWLPEPVGHGEPGLPLQSREKPHLNSASADGWHCSTLLQEP